jgi:hypothetical protein
MADSIESLQGLIMGVALLLSLIVFPALGLIWVIFKKRIQKALNLSDEQTLMIEKLIENGKQTDVMVTNNMDKIGKALRAITALSPEAKKKLDENQVNLETWTKDVNFTTEQLKVIYEILEGYAGQLKDTGTLPKDATGNVEVKANTILANRGIRDPDPTL